MTPNILKGVKYMIKIEYKHPLHGKQEILCRKLVKQEEGLLVQNIHGVTFQLIDPKRIISIMTAS